MLISRCFDEVGATRAGWPDLEAGRVGDVGLVATERKSVESLLIKGSVRRTRESGGVSMNSSSSSVSLSARASAEGITSNCGGCLATTPPPLSALPLEPADAMTCLAETNRTRLLVGFLPDADADADMAEGTGQTLTLSSCLASCLVGASTRRDSDSERKARSMDRSACVPDA